jgi:hypothetical protein
MTMIRESLQGCPGDPGLTHCHTRILRREMPDTLWSKPVPLYNPSRKTWNRSLENVYNKPQRLVYPFVLGLVE